MCIRILFLVICSILPFFYLPILLLLSPGVVFMTFWQGFVIQVMASLGMVNDKAALQIQNLLICIEMLIASLAHFYIFPYHEWQEGYKREKQKSTLIRDTLALQDFVRDMQVMTTPWDTAPDPSAPNGTTEGHAVAMCFEEAEGGKGTYSDAAGGGIEGDRPDGAAVRGQAETGRIAASDIDRCRSERSDRSEWSSGDSRVEDLDLEGGESYFSYTSILFNQGGIQADSRPAATMMHSLYSDNPLRGTPSQRSKSMGGSSLPLPHSPSVKPEHGYRALRGDDRDSLPVPELRRGTSGLSVSSSGGGGGGGDLAAALGSINRNMIELSELGILDLGPNGAAGMLFVVHYLLCVVVA
jgi:Organic solute transporter Ostalpha